MLKPVLSTSITPSRAQLQSIGGSEENRSGVTAGGKTDMKSQVLDTRLNLMTSLMGQQWATKWHHNNTNSMQLQPKREPCQVGQPVLDLRTNWINQHRLPQLPAALPFLNCMPLPICGTATASPQTSLLRWPREPPIPGNTGERSLQDMGRNIGRNTVLGPESEFTRLTPSPSAGKQLGHLTIKT